MICRSCNSTNFRCSHFRLIDLQRLFFLQLPVRCRNCNERDYVGLWGAWTIYKADRARHRARRSVQSISR
jgi:hypothetical protein